MEISGTYLQGGYRDFGGCFARKEDVGDDGVDLRVFAFLAILCTAASVSTPDCRDWEGGCTLMSCSKLSHAFNRAAASKSKARRLVCLRDKSSLAPPSSRSSCA